MALGKLWAGRVFGTNTGNLFVKFEGDDNALTGTLRHNDPDTGLGVYQIHGTYDGTRLSIAGTPQAQVDGVEFGDLTASATLDARGNLVGEWETSIGSAGTFVLFPHVHQATPATGELADQLYTARHEFGPVEIDRDQIVALADDIQKSFPNGRLVVTITTDTEQSRFLEEFKRVNLSASRAKFLKLFVREPDRNGIDRIVIVEFGQFENSAMCQGGNESWALGELQKLKRDIGRFERVYATKALGTSINQIMLVGAVVFLPELALWGRVILMVGVIGLALGVTWIHGRYLPHAAINLSKRREGWLSRLLPSFASWVVGIIASVIATLLGAYLKGWLPLPAP